MSWRHYVYGMAYISRATNRALLDGASSTRAAGATKDEYSRWRDEVGEGTR